MVKIKLFTLLMLCKQHGIMHNNCICAKCDLNRPILNVIPSSSHLSPLYPNFSLHEANEQNQMKSPSGAQICTLPSVLSRSYSHPSISISDQQFFSDYSQTERDRQTDKHAHTDRAKTSASFSLAGCR